MKNRRKQIETAVIEALEGLGVYRKEFDMTINVYVDMLHQYEILTKKFKEEGYELTEEHTNAVGAVNTKKKPILTALEKLRVDIGSYSSLLCINPKQFNATKVENTKTGKLAEMLKGMK